MPQIFLWCTQGTWCGAHRQFLSQTSVPEVQTDAIHMLCHVKLIQRVFVHVQERQCLWCVWERLEESLELDFQSACLFAYISHHSDNFKTRQAWLLLPLFDIRRETKGAGKGREGGRIICKWPPKGHLNFMGLEFSSSNLNNQMWERKRKKNPLPAYSTTSQML